MAPYELALSTVLGIVTVSVLALLFIPHWAAVFFVGPIVAMLYIDLLGFIQLLGIHISPVTYVAMVMSIGLMVDYAMHITFRFMEIHGSSRLQKSQDTLETIGASIMIGAFTTIVGVLPLAFSSSEVFFTIFVVFFGLVLVGCLHGLVLLPVILSILGPMKGFNRVPEETVRMDKVKGFNGVPEETVRLDKERTNGQLKETADISNLSEIEV